MKNKIVRYLHLIFCSLIFILCITACGGEEIELSTDGRLTITGLDDYNGQEIYAHKTDSSRSLRLDAFGRIIGNNRIWGKISSGQTTLNVYEAGNHATSDLWTTHYNWSNYNGNDQNVKFAVCIVGKMYGFVTVNFTDGIASGRFEPNGGKTYTVTFEYNDGRAASTQTVFDGGTATRPSDPDWSGYILADWYSDEELTTVYNFSTPLTADITLYAKWEEPAVKHLYGTWTGTRYDTYTLTISANEIMWVDSRTRYVRYTNVVWTQAENNPRLFYFTGTRRTDGYSSVVFDYIRLENRQSVYLSPYSYYPTTYTKVEDQ